MNSTWFALALLASPVPLRAQNTKPLGTVAAASATVSATDPASALQPVANGRLPVTSGSTITAKPGINAEIALARGGSILVCQTTGLHLTAGTSDALMLALGRGAIEVRTNAGTGEVIVTPDMRLIPTTSGPLDLRMRVTYNGDTCVENRGRNAPPLDISDAFGELNYLLKPGQHVMFEHGSLRTVDDHETTPCGCPPDQKPPEGISLAEALLRGGQTSPPPPTRPLTPQQAEAAHPFPVAISDGLAAPPPSAPEVPGERHVQVASTLRFDPGEPSPAPSIAPTIFPTEPPPAHPKSNPFTAIGHFFKRLFVR